MHLYLQLRGLSHVMRKPSPSAESHAGKKPSRDTELLLYDGVNGAKPMKTAKAQQAGLKASPTKTNSRYEEGAALLDCNRELADLKEQAIAPDDKPRRTGSASSSNDEPPPNPSTYLNLTRKQRCRCGCPQPTRPPRAPPRGRRTAVTGLASRAPRNLRHRRREPYGHAGWPPSRTLPGTSSPVCVRRRTRKKHSSGWPSFMFALVNSDSAANEHRERKGKAGGILFCPITHRQP